MARHPVVITPLEEDLRQIGLLREQDDEAPAPEPDPEGGYTAVGDEEPEDEPDKPMGEQADDEEPAPEPDPEGGYATEEEGDEEDDDEEDKAVEAIGTLAGHFIAQHQAIGPKPSGAMESKPKAVAKPVRESKAQRVQRLAQGQIFNAAPKAAKEPTSRVAALLEEVSDIVGDIHRSRKEEQIKGFANIAVIANTLAERFSEWGMALSEGNLYRVGSMMQRLSEQAADMAVQLDTPPGEEEPEPEEATAVEQEPGEGEPEAGGDDAKVDELFKKLMAKLLDALQLYNDVTGKSEGDELPGDDKEDSVADAEDDDEDDAENDPEIDDAGMDAGEADEIPGDEDDEPDMEGGDIPPGIKTSETDPEGDDEEDDEEPPMGEQEGDEEGDKEDDEDPPSPYGQGAEEAAIAEARKRLQDMKKKLTAKKKGKGKVLKGGKGKLQDGLPFVHTTKGKPGGKKRKRK